MAEGQRKAEVSKQPALSSRLMQMKFMQRGKEKTVLKEAAAEQVLSSLVRPSTIPVICHTSIPALTILQYLHLQY